VPQVPGKISFAAGGQASGGAVRCPVAGQDLGGQEYWGKFCSPQLANCGSSYVVELLPVDVRARKGSIAKEEKELVVRK